MYLFFHLITGIILGLLIADLLHDRRWLIPCAIGAILPDIIDQPIGLILFQSVFGYGRLFLHILLVFVIILVIGLVLWRYRRTPIYIALAIGILSHQILDSMWNEPTSWLYPFLGTPDMWGTYLPGDFIALVRADLLNPSEWFMAALFLAGLGIYKKRDWVIAAAQGHRKVLKPILGGFGILLWIISGIVITYGILRKILSHYGRFGLSNYLIYGFVFAISAFLLWRWGLKLETSSGKHRAELP